MNATPVNGDRITIKTARATKRQDPVPAYFRDYATLRWSGSDANDWSRPPWAASCSKK